MNSNIYDIICSNVAVRPDDLPRVPLIFHNAQRLRNLLVWKQSDEWSARGSSDPQ